MNPISAPQEPQFHTSQQKRGEHHKAEGNKEGQKPGIQWGSELAPTGLPTSEAMTNSTHTTANMRGELSTPES